MTFDAKQARENVDNHVDHDLQEILDNIEKESKEGHRYCSWSNISFNNFNKLKKLGFSLDPDKEYPNHYYITW